MIEAITKEAEVKKSVEKVRAVNPEIIVRIRAIDNKPYYLIRYLDLSDCKLHEAYGSFRLECVIGWLNEYFDVVDTNCGWIPCSERLPEEEEDVLVCIKETEYACDGEVTDEVNGIYYWMYVGYFLCGKWYTVLCHDNKKVEKENEETPYCQHEVVAWMPLPEAYKEPEK